MDMETIKSFVTTHPREICITAVVGVALIAVIRRRRKREKKVYPPNTIVHHQMGRGPYAPSLTPFAVKLETYLRMAKVPFLNEHDSVTNKSSKNKVTWIECNGEEVADSEFCIQYVNNKFNVDLDKGFSDEDRAAALAIQRMVDEHLYWAVALQRWVYDPKDGINVSKNMNFSWTLAPLVRRMIAKQSYAQGVGRHTEEEVHHVMHEDLKALSMFIGNKKFLFGDRVCQADSSVFGMLSQLYWQSYGGYGEKAIHEYPNLCAYCDRMKAEYWPDWDDCITHGWTRKATK
ncbi:failed axon connections homolog isoform X2 [Ostrea edulis]|uniref:failed axon connections homolog isoform X2 n=1 Tax=Ostrea edulis TaxID=37623 RepID=UPI002095948F|nr:failed axon connections homolog isoform X2 [Ostrea edulis]XP_056019630.1 failed axon connections homolog isoform X2 [Ostrea edulis]